MEVVYKDISTRDARPRYVAKQYKPYLTRSILDIGCDQEIVREELKVDQQYIGIDITGDMDIRVNLEKSPYLPFTDSSFGTAICLDVLEHLDELHRVFEEIVRVTSNHIILSLPNNWTNLRHHLTKGYGRPPHYGLPPEKPADRHKWFFNASQAKEFIQAKAEEFNLTISDFHVAEKPRFFLKRWIRRAIYPNYKHYLNLYGHPLWTVLSH